MVGLSKDAQNLYKSQRLDHLGLVAGMFEELGLGSVLDQCLGTNAQAGLSPGMCLKAMIVNGLGFTSRPLYLSASFFGTKAVGQLLGPGIEASQITDQRLGNFLESCYEYGCTKLFSQISWEVFRRLKLSGPDRFVHLDTTSVSVQGEYKQGSDALNITFGHSKDHRPDLKQFMISLMVEPRHGIPWLFKALDGNTSDKTHFQQVIGELAREARDQPGRLYLVADSALYTKKSLREIDTVYWLTRVPHTHALAKRVVTHYTRQDMGPEDEKGYAFRELAIRHLGIDQRWVVIWSRQAYQREKQSLRRAWKKEQAKIEDQLRALARREFHCREDAKGALEKLARKWKYHLPGSIEWKVRNLTGKRGRPKKDAPPPEQRFRLYAQSITNVAALRKALAPLGKFILATNELDQEALPAAEILPHYKDQNQVEKGFRFLKSPMCMAESVFLKKPKRIVALAMVMCLALMVYAMAERKLREALKQANQTVPNQKGKAYQKPTMRWIFQCFEGIEILSIHQNDQNPQLICLNLRPLHRQILQLLGPTFQKIYLDSS
ncbi:MAG: IS1634 family transposase [Bacteroidota bacterium]